MEEEWRQCCEFPSYDISNYGEVRNRKTGRIIKTRILDDKYERVDLSENGITRTRNIHTLVADAYVPGYEEGLRVTHKDGDTLNSISENLEWRSRSYIAKKAYENGQYRNNRMKPIMCIETGEAFESLSDCSRKTGLSRNGISRSVNNPASCTKGGFHFRALND